MQFEISLEGLSDQGSAREHDSKDNITEQSTTEEQNKKNDQPDSLHNDDAIQDQASLVLHQVVQDVVYSALPNDPEVLPASGNKNDKYILPTNSPSTLGSVHPEPIALSLTDKGKTRLAMIGLAIEDFVFFVTWFIGHRWEFVEYLPDKGWRSRGRRYLIDWQLVRHLAWDIVVGTGCRWDDRARELRTRHIAIDVDHDGDDADLRARYDRVLAALGAPSYVVRSSNSGGLHVYYLLTRSESLHALRSFDGKNGDVVRLLEAEGLHHEKGRVEVYPQGQYKDRGQQNRLRAPFGIGSCLLDPITLNPIAEPGPASLVRARKMFERGEVRLVDPMVWAANRRTLPPPPPPPPPRPTRPRPATPTRRRKRPVDGRRTARTRTAPSGHEPTKVERLLAQGLTRQRELNDAAGALAFHFRYGLDLSQEETTARLLEWLESHHNGKSRTYNASPKKARAEVTGVVERVFKRKPKKAVHTQKRLWVRVETLSEFEARSVLAAFERDADACDPHTGDLLDPYKLRLFGFEALRLAKQYVLTFLADAIQAAGDQPVPDEVIASIWPDRSRPEFIVISPSELREGRGRAGTRFFKGIGRDTRWRYWRVVQHAGLFQLHRKGWSFPWGGQAAQYVVRLDFGAYSRDGVAFATFDTALVGLLDPIELRARFGDYRCKKLAKGEAVQAAIGADNDARRAVDLLVRLLREPADQKTPGNADAA